MTDYRLRELKIEINRNCPLNCLHCSSNGMPGAPERLDPHTISNIIKEFVYLGGERLCISGGEPLCYEELSSVISSTRGTNIELSLYTTGIARNGSPAKPLSERTVDFLAENNVKLVFSLHGANDKTHDKLTQVQGSFNSTITAIERTIDAGVIVELHVVPTSINLLELFDIAGLARSFNIKKVSWLRFVPQGRGYFNQPILQLSVDQIAELGDIKSKIQETCNEVTIRTGAPFNILCSDVASPCEAGINVLTIGPDGSVSPCDAFKRFDIRDGYGNVLMHSLSDVWSKSYFLNSIRTLHEKDNNSQCTSCSLYTRCHSGCLAQKAIAKGELSEGRDPRCPLGYSEEVRDGIKAITV